MTRDNVDLFWVKAPNGCNWHVLLEQLLALSSTQEILIPYYYSIDV